MTDFIILTILLLASVVGGWYLKREAVRERSRRQLAREADEARSREVLDEWLRARVDHWLKRSGQSEAGDRIPDEVRDSVESLVLRNRTDISDGSKP